MIGRWTDFWEMGFWFGTCRTHIKRVTTPLTSWIAAKAFSPACFRACLVLHITQKFPPITPRPYPKKRSIIKSGTISGTTMTSLPYRFSTHSYPSPQWPIVSSYRVYLQLWAGHRKRAVKGLTRMSWRIL